MATRIDTKSLTAFAQRQAAKFIRAATDIAADELADITDGDIATDVDTSEREVRGTITLTSPTAVIDETGTESRPPNPKISRLVKDRNLRTRIFKKAAQSLK